MTTIPCFQLEVASPTLGTAGPGATMSCLDLAGDAGKPSEGDIPGPGNTETPENSKRKGSFRYDREKGGYNLEWTSAAEFDMWRRQEEITHSIQFAVSRTSGPSGADGWLFTKKKTYRCSRQETGGERHYQKKHPDRKQKIKGKKMGCSCQITIKLYPHTTTILGRYDADHDHEVGLANIAYTRMSDAARDKINWMLTQKIDQKEIVCK